MGRKNAIGIKSGLKSNIQNTVFCEELLDFARKMMQKISNDIDKNQKTPPPEIYSFINILKEIPFVKQYTDSLQQEKIPKQKPTGYLSPDIVHQIEREILGME